MYFEVMLMIFFLVKIYFTFIELAGVSQNVQTRDEITIPVLI